MKFIHDVLMFWLDLSVHKDHITSDPERRRNSNYFGIRSIISSLLGFIVAALCGWGFFALSGTGDGLGVILVIILMVILALMAILSFLQGIVQGFVCFIYQLRINKKPIGWVALAIWLVLLLTVIITLLVLLV